MFVTIKVLAETNIIATVNSEQLLLTETSFARGDTICPRPSPPGGRPSASRAAQQTQRSSIVSHAQYLLTVTAAPASRVRAVVSKVAL